MVRHFRHLLSLILTIVLLLIVAHPTAAQSSSTFTYQGYLTNAGGPVTASCDFQFSLFNASSAGAQIGSTLTRTGVTVTQGVFSVQLDFGLSAFDSVPRYLAIEAKCGRQGSYTALSPRQALTAAPFATTAFITPFAWSLSGNAATNPATQFIGTTDNQAFEVRVNNLRALRIEPKTDVNFGTVPNVIGGSPANTVSAGVFGATIAGGGATESNQDRNRVTGSFSTIGGGTGNTASNFHSTISGGNGNIANGFISTVGGGGSNAASGDASTLGGGIQNTVSGYGSTVGGGSNNAASGIASTVGGGSSNAADGYRSTVSGGFSNDASSAYSSVGGGGDNIASGLFSTVGGGYHNIASGVYSTVSGGLSNAASNFYSNISGGQSNTASKDYSTIGGGHSNTTSGLYSTVSGGLSNTASDTYSTIGGGHSNTASGLYSTIGGGFSNTASGEQSTVGGGISNSASSYASVVGGGLLNVASGDYSYASGRRGKADDVGAFVWADSQDADIFSPGANTFTVRALGGIWLGTGAAPTTITAGRFIDTSTGAYLSTGGTWVNASDRALKANFTQIDPRAILNAVAAMPITAWNYTIEGDGIKHVGPTAQDFRAAFGLGQDDKSITTVDAAGVVLAAIQGLKAENDALKADVALLKLAAGNGLVLPALIVAFGMVFLGAALIVTRRNGLRTKGNLAISQN